MPAFAQESDSAQGAETGGVEEIVVTARKRQETSQDVPVAVTAISAAQIDRYDLTSIEKVAASMGQLTVGRNSTGSGAQITLRGIGTAPSSIGIEQSVAVVVDGVYYGQGRIINEGFFDASSIEVLKGPQALFFGKNATAGVINIATNDPGNAFEASLRTGYEFKSGTVYGEGVVSTPINDTTGIRVAVRGSSMSGGYFRNEGMELPYITTDRTVDPALVTSHLQPVGPVKVSGEKEFMGRVTLKSELTDRLTATLKASYSRTKVNNPASNRVAYECDGGDTWFNTALSCGKRFAVYNNAMPSDIAATIPVAGDGSQFNKYTSWGVTGTLEYSGEALTVTSVTNFQKNRNRLLVDGDFGSATAGATWAVEDSRWRAFSSELRALTSFQFPLNVMIGGLFQDTRRDFVQYVVNGGADNPAVADPSYRYAGFVKNSFTDGKTLAVYGQAILKPVESVEITGGVRYTHETKKSEFIQPYASLALFAPGVLVSADQTFNNWSPEATIRWKPAEGINVFASYKTAYKSGGFSNSGINSVLASVDNFTFGPEKAEGFEGGIKTTLLDRQLRLNLIGYTYRYKNLQIDFFDSSVFAFNTINAGSVRTKGLELEVQYAPYAVPGLSVRGTLNYNHARYEDFLAPCYAGQTIVQGCSLPNRYQDLSGTETAMAPAWTGTFGVTYETSVTDSAKLNLSVDTKYSDSYLPSGFGNPYSRQSSYLSVDATAKLSFADHWDLALIGKNLTNRFVATGVVDGPGTGSGTGTAAGIHADQIGLISLPRSVQLQLTWRY
ncbi:TonB-dependent receptor [Novosphingobium album (ex Hu et al. 2023)]|uniref:TonB-dependent receptor n=1 Tax=Novosphingobium album (ex Hu et al. 2023) TaxID=2930093 RepID=A0ABT0B2Y3_9SPHN|nr:TonB-dependent receptor [Novosphingobium album (ex Hu et al. 2023)]MCJ2179402.1 TonB-dependent receptor [Novosphingobium album (ex Hu et al. 2023)]